MQDQIDETTFLQHGRWYAFGRGADFYGVWNTTVSPAQLIERFPLDPESWHRARRRFEELEQLANGSPPRATAVTSAALSPQPTTSDPYLIASSLAIFVGVIVGVAALFPRYLGSTSLVDQGDQLLPHIFYLVGWSATGAALYARRPIARAGMMFGLGLSAMTFGFYLSDLGSAISSGASSGGVGLYLGIIGWLICSAGCVGALFRLPSTFKVTTPTTRRLPYLVVATLFAVATAVTFVPSWDRYTLFSPTSGQSQSVTEGFAFSNPGVVVAGDVFAMIFLVALVGLALSSRDLRLGVALFAGAILPHVAQIFSALIQIGTPPSVSAFGINPAQAAAAQLQVSATLTPWFYLYCACVGLLIASVALTTRSASGETRTPPPLTGPNDQRPTYLSGGRAPVELAAR